MTDIFISYASEDFEWVKRFVKALKKQCDWNIWWDQQIPTGKRFADVIEEQVETAKCVIVIWSQASIDSNWVRAEATAGLDRSILIPIQIEAVEPPLVFRRIQTADLSAWKGQVEQPIFKTLLDDITIMLQESSQSNKSRQIPKASTPQKRGKTFWLLTIFTFVILGGFAAAFRIYFLNIKAQEKIELARELTAHSIAYRNKILAREPGENGNYWWYLLQQNNREDLLQKSVLLALESLHLHTSKEAEIALQKGLGLLTRSIINSRKSNSTVNIAFHPGGELLATNSDMPRMWELATGKEAAHFDLERPRGLAFDSQGKLLATGSLDGAVCIWDVGSGKERLKFSYHGRVKMLAFSPDGKHLAVGGEGKYVQVWDVDTNERLFNILHDSEIQQLAYSPDGLFLAITDNNYHAVIVDANNGLELSKLDIDRHGKMAFSPDSSSIATGGREGEIIIWMSLTGERITSIKTDSLSIEDLEYSPDGKYLAAALRNDVAGIWLTSDYSELGQVRHDDRVIAIDFSKDSRFLATSSQDATARVWQLNSLDEVARMPHKTNVDEVAFSPNGQYLASRDQRGVLGLWLITPDDWQKEACLRLSRNFTPDEWQQFMGDVLYQKTCPELP